MTDSLQQVDAALGILAFFIAVASLDQIKLQATDRFGNIITGSLVVTVTPPAPILTAPSMVTVPVDKPSAVSGLDLQEPGSAAGAIFTAALSDDSGLLSAAGPGVSGSGTANLGITETLAQVGAALATLTVLEENVSPDTITLDVNDGTSDTSASIEVLVAGRPAIVGPLSITVVAGVVNVVTGFSLSENGATLGETFSVSLADTCGLLTATGCTVSGSGTDSLTITGSLTQINAELATLSDTTVSAGTDAISVEVADSFGNTSNKTIAVAVNSASVIIAENHKTVELAVLMGMSPSWATPIEPQRIRFWKCYTSNLSPPERWPWWHAAEFCWYGSP